MCLELLNRLGDLLVQGERVNRSCLRTRMPELLLDEPEVLRNGQQSDAVKMSTRMDAVSSR